MAGEYYVQLLLVGARTVPLGHVYHPGDLPRLLRHVADYYDDNPGACDALFNPLSPLAVPRDVAFPFSPAKGEMGDDEAPFGAGGP